MAIPVIAVLLLLYKCSSDFEVNADYKGHTVIYGLLDQNETRHYIRINRSFLGKEDASVMAQVRDSLEYANLTAKVERWRNGTLVNTYTLKDTVLDNKQDGYFASPTQTVYYFDEAQLVDPALPREDVATYEFKIIVTVPGQSDEVYATTNLVPDFDVKNPRPNNTFGGNSTTLNFSAALGKYSNQSVKWTSSTNSKRYEVTVAFHYEEVFLTSTGALDSVKKIMQWSLGEARTSDDELSEDLEKTLSGEDFYTRLANNIVDDPLVVRRKAGGMDFILSAGNEEFDTYMLINQPVTGVVQERPSYTNVVNGLGIFASRYSKQILDKRLSLTALRELNEGAITGHLVFCSDSAQYQGQTFYCY